MSESGPLNHSDSDGAPTQKNSKAPAVIPDYQLVRRIGSGSYGEVWIGRSVTGRYRAIKIIHRHTFDTNRPFDREFSGIQKFEPISLSHEGLVDILHVGRNDDAGFFYYVMELADDRATGQEIDPQTYEPRSLGAETRNGGRLPVDECIRLGVTLSGALAFLHEKSLVHRDIKPSNIIFVGCTPKLADIGLVAALDETHSFVGTEGFVPREGPGAPQADIYALGKVLYEVATGKDRNDFPELPDDVNETPEGEKLLQLNKVLLRACENDVRERYQSASEMLADLVTLQEGKRLRARRTARSVRIHILLAILLVVVAVTVGVVSWSRAVSTSDGMVPPTPPPSRERYTPSLVLSWTRQTSLPAVGTQFDPVESRGNLFVPGGSNETGLQTVYVATVNADGSLASWETTTPLPEPVESPGTVVMGNWMYIASEKGKIYRAAIRADGGLEKWHVSDGAAPWMGGRLTLRAFRDHLYLLGGFHYVLYDTVAFAAIRPDGSPDRWRQTTSMPEPRQHYCLHFLGDRAYIVGGITSQDQILSSVYSAPVLSDGTLDDWRREADLPAPLWYHNSVLLGDCIILFGGMTGYTSGTSLDVLCGHIGPEDGKITRWVKLGEMPGDYVAGVGVVHSPRSGRVYLIGGQKGYRGEYTSEVWSISAQELKDAFAAVTR